MRSKSRIHLFFYYIGTYYTYGSRKIFDSRHFIKLFVKCLIYLIIIYNSSLYSSFLTVHFLLLANHIRSLNHYITTIDSHIHLEVFYFLVLAAHSLLLILLFCNFFRFLCLQIQTTHKKAYHFLFVTAHSHLTTHLICPTLRLCSLFHY